MVDASSKKNKSYSALFFIVCVALSLLVIGAPYLSRRSLKAATSTNATRSYTYGFGNLEFVSGDRLNAIFSAPTVDRFAVAGKKPLVGEKIYFLDSQKMRTTIASYMATKKFSCFKIGNCTPLKVKAFQDVLVKKAKSVILNLKTSDVLKIEADHSLPKLVNVSIESNKGRISGLTKLKISLDNLMLLTGKNLIPIPEDYPGFTNTKDSNVTNKKAHGMNDPFCPAGKTCTYKPNPSSTSSSSAGSSSSSPSCGSCVKILIVPGVDSWRSGDSRDPVLSSIAQCAMDKENAGTGSGSENWVANINHSMIRDGHLIAKGNKTLSESYNDKVDQLQKDNPNCKIITLGHSFGAMVSTLGGGEGGCGPNSRTCGMVTYDPPLANGWSAGPLDLFAYLTLPLASPQWLDINANSPAMKKARTPNSCESRIYRQAPDPSQTPPSKNESPMDKDDFSNADIATHSLESVDSKGRPLPDSQIAANTAKKQELCDALAGKIHSCQCQPTATPTPTTPPEKTATPVATLQPTATPSPTATSRPTVTATPTPVAALDDPCSAALSAPDSGCSALSAYVIQVCSCYQAGDPSYANPRGGYGWGGPPRTCVCTPGDFTEHMQQVDSCMRSKFAAGFTAAAKDRMQTGLGQSLNIANTVTSGGNICR